MIETLVEQGTTLLLTTQYLEEADRLAHDIAVVDHGKVIARGTADQLKAQIGGERVEVVVHDRTLLGQAVEALAPYAKGDPAVEKNTRRITVPVSGGAKVLADVIRELDARSIEIDDIGLRRPTLDDVFLSLTGHATSAADAENGKGDGDGHTKRHGRDKHADGAPDADAAGADQQAVTAGKDV